MADAMNYRELVLQELSDIPEEFIPLVFEQIRVFKRTVAQRMNQNISPASPSPSSPVQRMLNLAGTLENPQGLTAKQYKKAVVDEYFSRHK